MALNPSFKVLRFIVILCSIYLVYSIFFKREKYEMITNKKEKRSKSIKTIITEEVEKQKAIEEEEGQCRYCNGMSGESNNGNGDVRHCNFC